MKGLIKKVRENKKGFTLAELLVVVAIVGILVAISIPVFTAPVSYTHLDVYKRQLDALHVDYTHIMVDGKIVATGDGSLVCLLYTSNSGGKT